MAVEAGIVAQSLALRPYQELLHLALAQCEALRNQDMDRFGLLSTERDGLVGRLSVPATDRERRLARQVLAEVQRLDLAGQDFLRSEMQATQDEISKLRRGRTALRGYGLRARQATETTGRDRLA